MKPRCDAKIVQAHTIPKSSSLKRIAKDNHVYGFKTNQTDLTKNNGKTRPKLIGINNASTFTGFCRIHDNDIFSPLEKTVLEPTSEQCFLAGYRATARDLYAKRVSIKYEQILRESDRGRSSKSQRFVNFLSDQYSASVKSGLRDIIYSKKAYDIILIEKSFARSRAIVIEFDGFQNVLCSGATQPLNTTCRTQLQDIRKLYKLHKHISCTSMH